MKFISKIKNWFSKKNKEEEEPDIIYFVRGDGTLRGIYLKPTGSFDNNPFTERAQPKREMNIND